MSVFVIKGPRPLVKGLRLSHRLKMDEGGVKMPKNGGLWGRPCSCRRVTRWWEEECWWYQINWAVQSGPAAETVPQPPPPLSTFTFTFTWAPSYRRLLNLTWGLLLSLLVPPCPLGWVRPRPGLYDSPTPPPGRLLISDYYVISDYYTCVWQKCS